MPRTAPLAAALSTASLLSRRHLFKLLIFTAEAVRCDRQHDMIRPPRRLHATRANVFFYVSTPVRLTFRETCRDRLLQSTSNRFGDLREICTVSRTCEITPHNTLLSCSTRDCIAHASCLGVQYKEEIDKRAKILPASTTQYD